MSNTTPHGLKTNFFDAIHRHRRVNQLRASVPPSKTNKSVAHKARDKHTLLFMIHLLAVLARLF